jgi:hypothetical protein
MVFHEVLEPKGRFTWQRISDISGGFNNPNKSQTSRPHCTGAIMNDSHRIFNLKLTLSHSLLERFPIP